MAEARAWQLNEPMHRLNYKMMHKCLQALITPELVVAQDDSCDGVVHPQSVGEGLRMTSRKVFVVSRACSCSFGSIELKKIDMKMVQKSPTNT